MTTTRWLSGSRLAPGNEFSGQLPHGVRQGQRRVYLRLGDFLVSCVAQLTSRNSGTYSLGFSSDQVLCSRIVRLILTGHDGILPVDGDLARADRLAQQRDTASARGPHV